MNRLSPPWYTLWNEIKSSIGNDPEIIVSPLDTSTEPYLIKVVTNNEEKGKALTTILTPSFQLGNIQVTVDVENSSGEKYKDVAVQSPSDIATVIKTAFKDNDWFVDVIVKSVAPYPGAPTVVYPVFQKGVIQFFNDELADVYNNYNNVAAAVFSNVLVEAINGTSINCSTSK